MTRFEQAKERLVKARDKSLVELLKKEGYEIRDMGSSYTCLSPLRIEGKGSFSISKKTGKWRDYGDGKHGDILDFVMEFKGISLNEAITFLLGEKSLDIPVYVPEKRKRNAVEIIKTEELSHPYLTSYIVSRKIDLNIASRWLKQLTVKLPYSKYPEKEHIFCAFANDSRGYELRNKYRKIGNSPKNITTIKGDVSDNRLLLFEGWPDFLSYLTFYNITYPPTTTIVLNSLSFLNSIIPMLQGKDVLYFGQNDKSANKSYKRLRKEGIFVIDKRYIYKPYKDFNEFLIKNSTSRLGGVLK